jgi:quinoprotein glucose dehydrogenase
LAAKHGIKEFGPILRDLVADKLRPTAVRIETLKALEALKDSRLKEAAQIALDDADPRLRHQGRRVLLQQGEPQDAVQELSRVLAKGAVVERQGALQILADLKHPLADTVLGQQLDQLLLGKAPAELHLDILLAAQGRATPALKTQLARHEAARIKTDPLGAYRESILGGDAEAGRRIFFEKAEVYCVRCHKVGGTGGEVGPDLSGIAKRSPRDYLLEAIVEPNRQIAKGFETVVLTLNNGQIKTGILKSEDEREVRLMTAEGQLVAVRKSDIDERQRGPSAMPGDLVQKMSRTELRDLVEFLANLR